MIITAVIVFAIVFAFALAGGFYFYLVRGANPQIVGALFFGVIGAGIIGVGFVLALDNYRFTGRAESAPGEIISDGKTLGQDSDGKFIYYYAPTVRFKTRHGQVVEFYGASSNHREYDQGERVEVLYLPEQPKEARVKGFEWRWLIAVALAGMGNVFLGIAGRAAFARSENTEQVDRTNKRKHRAV